MYARGLFPAQDFDHPGDAAPGADGGAERREEADDEDVRDGVFVEVFERVDVDEVFAIRDGRFAKPRFEETQYDARADDRRCGGERGD